MNRHDIYHELKENLCKAFRDTLSLHQVSSDIACGFIEKDCVNAIMAAIIHSSAQSLASVQAGLEEDGDVTDSVSFRNELSNVLASALKREFIGDLERNECIRSQHYVKSEQ